MQRRSGQAKLAHGVHFGLALGLVGLVVLVLVVTPWGAQLWALLHDPSVEHARRILATTTVWLPLVIIGLMLLHTLVPVPAEVLALAAGMALGPFWGVVTVWAGAMLGAYFGFFLARTYGLPLLRRLVAPQRLEHMQRRIEPMNWLRVLRSAEAARIGQGVWQQPHMRTVGSEKYVDSVAECRARIRMIAAFFGPCTPYALTSHVSVFSHYFKRLDQFAKLATSSV
jgi:hypothetical protein